MAELAIGQLIKIILGVLVVVAVIVFLYFAFKERIFGFFDRDLPLELVRCLF